MTPERAQTVAGDPDANPYDWPEALINRV